MRATIVMIMHESKEKLCAHSCTSRVRKFHYHSLPRAPASILILLSSLLSKSVAVADTSLSGRSITLYGSHPRVTLSQSCPKGLPSHATARSKTNSLSASLMRVCARLPFYFPLEYFTKWIPLKFKYACRYIRAICVFRVKDQTSPLLLRAAEMSRITTRSRERTSLRN